MRKETSTIWYRAWVGVSKPGQRSRVLRQVAFGDLNMVAEQLLNQKLGGFTRLPQGRRFRPHPRVHLEPLKQASLQYLYS